MTDEARPAGAPEPLVLPLSHPASAGCVFVGAGVITSPFLLGAILFLPGAVMNLIQQIAGAAPAMATLSRPAPSVVPTGEFWVGLFCLTVYGVFASVLFWSHWRRRGFGTLYVYEDRLMWRLWRCTECVYFSGTEEVRLGLYRVIFAREGIRIRIPYAAYAKGSSMRFHDALCRYSRPYGALLEARLPFELKAAPGPFIAICLAFAAFVTLVGLITRATPATLLMFCSPLLAGALLILLLTPRGWRFEPDEIRSRWLGLNRRLDPTQLRALFEDNGKLLLRFSNGRSLSLSQSFVRYPLPLLAGQLASYYRRPLARVEAGNPSPGRAFSQGPANTE